MTGGEAASQQERGLFLGIAGDDQFVVRNPKLRARAASRWVLVRSWSCWLASTCCVACPRRMVSTLVQLATAARASNQRELFFFM